MPKNKNNTLPLYCNQCEMSTPGGCGSDGQYIGTCLKDATLARLQDIVVYGVKGLAAYREHARELGADTLAVAIVLSWMEQKAVIILLALFSLGIKSIYLGPKSPQFVNGPIFDFLVQTFDLHLTGDAAEDLSNLLIEKQAA